MVWEFLRHIVRAKKIILNFLVRQRHSRWWNFWGARVCKFGPWSTEETHNVLQKDHSSGFGKEERVSIRSSQRNGGVYNPQHWSLIRGNVNPQRGGIGHQLIQTTENNQCQMVSTQHCYTKGLTHHTGSNHQKTQSQYTVTLTRCSSSSGPILRRIL